ncbi:MAG: extracellular solute-binding protein [Clostridia bacterium]|nr:extracellular solute-binding protein [Clostridia bacterium]
MKKIISFLILSAILITFFASCHGRSALSDFDVPDSFDESRHFTINFWAKNDTNKVQSAIYTKAKNDFEALYPNVTVNVRFYTNYGDIYNDVITNIATKTTPNVCITYPDHIATYMTGENIVAPLDALMADKEYGLGGSLLKFDCPSKDEIIPEFLEEGYLGGAFYALPYMRSTEACYINKTFVEKLGYTLPETLTWDFVWEVSEAAMKKNADGTFAVNGQTVMIPFIYKSTDNMMIQYLRQADAPYSEEDGDILIFNDDTKSFLLDIADHVKAGAFSTFKITGYPANFLNAGQCIFAVDSTAGSTWMGSGAPLVDIAEEKIVDFETAVMTVPQLDPSSPKMISQGPSVCIFNKEDKQEVLASWLFAEFLLTDGVQIAYSKTEGYVPVTTSARVNPDYVDYLSGAGKDGDEHYSVKLDATKLLLENTENTFTTPVFNGSASLRDAAGQLIEEVTKSIRRRQTVDDGYIENLYENVASLYRLKTVESEGLPAASVVLIAAIGTAWVAMGIYVLMNKINSKKKKHSGA